jgi:hypothetical protein
VSAVRSSEMIHRRFPRSETLQHPQIGIRKICSENRVICQAFDDPIYRFVSEARLARASYVTLAKCLKAGIANVVKTIACPV